jgi:hypothetical protein
MSKTVENLSTLRQNLDAIIVFINSFKSDAQTEGAGRELALVLTKVEEARMWAGKGLSHFNTGFKDSDKAQRPETFSREVIEVVPTPTPELAEANTTEEPKQA